MIGAMAEDDKLLEEVVEEMDEEVILQMPYLHC